MTPEELRRGEFRRAQRRDAGVYFVGIAVALVVFIGGLAFLLSEIPNFGLGG